MNQIIDYKCKYLNYDPSVKEDIVELRGPITKLSFTEDMMMLLMSWRKKPEEMKAKFDAHKEELIAEALKYYGEDHKIIYFADPAAQYQLLGPKFAKKLTEDFTIPFLKDLSAALSPDALIYVCPKTSFWITGFELGEWKKIALEQPLPYSEACLSLSGKVRYLGSRCRRDEDLTVEHISYLELY